ncbi:hypothetical protein A5714_22400 [Mycobacterium sp. E2462]|uniref:tetratricopeptide repeat protein n=1 Tax=Mycobacterium sp. E2462 TaxID=1834133 RepID=UPI0008024AF0|nr:tetratricopeptide repeat protein [Mycobacterium sp. E2462]OBI07354.1 hypothetical protein A5714_22400 [Mycobacterium sp. E2462]
MTSQPRIEGIDEAIRVADAYVDANNYEHARDILRRSLSQNPNDPSLLASYARVEIVLGNNWQAAHSAYASLAGAPNYEFAMRIYALALYNLGRQHDGLLMAWRAVTSHPNQAAPLRLYAQLLHGTWQLPSALIVIDNALYLDPHDVDALIRRGAILHDMGRSDESDAAYQAALALDPANAQALNDLAVHRLRRFKLGPALRGFLGAAGSDPEYGNLSRWNIGVALQRVLMFVTIGAGVLSGLLACAAGLHSEGHPTATLRVFTGLLTVALIVVLGWLFRQIPRNIMVSVLKEQPFTALRIGHALAAVVAGAWVTAIPWPVGFIAVGGILTLLALVIVRVGFFIGK